MKPPDDTHTDVAEFVADDTRPLLRYEHEHGGRCDEAYRNQLRRKAQLRAQQRSLRRGSSRGG